MARTWVLNSFGKLQTQANATQAERRIRFVVILPQRQLLVGTDVERAQGQRMSAHACV